MEAAELEQVGRQGLAGFCRVQGLAGLGFRIWYASRTGCRGVDALQELCCLASAALPLCQLIFLLLRS